MIKPRHAHAVAISAIFLLAARLTHAQTGGMIWSQFFAVGGPLEGLLQTAPQIVCVQKGPLNFPILHPKPMNVDGSPAQCDAGGLLNNSGPIQVANPKPLFIYMSGEAEGIAGADPRADDDFHSFGPTPIEELTGPRIPLDASATINAVNGDGNFGSLSSSTSYYAEDIDCQCTGSASLADGVSLVLRSTANFAQTTGSSGRVSLQVLTVSEVDRKQDSFDLTALSATSSTTPLMVGPSGKFSVLITISATQTNQGDAAGSVDQLQAVPVDVPFNTESGSTIDPPGSNGNHAARHDLPPTAR